MANFRSTKIFGDLSVTGDVKISGNEVATKNWVTNTAKAKSAGAADTASKLTTARTIGGVSFDGSANINLPGVNTTGNQNTTGNAATATNADKLGGLELNSTTRNNEANKVMRTDASGYANFGWINTTSGNTDSTVTDVYVNTNDGYIRKKTLAKFKAELGSMPPSTHNHNQLYNTTGDTRDVATLPSDYNNVLKISGYKNSSAVGRDGSLMGVNGYADSSGGVLELSWNNGRFSFRTSKNSYEWNSWGEVASEQWVTSNTRSSTWMPTAGSNITISGNTISATDTTYSNASTSVTGLMSTGTQTFAGSKTFNSTVNIGSGANLNFNSDKRMKNINSEISYSGVLNKLSNIKIYDYVFKKDELQNNKIGVMAQDVEDQFPEIKKLLIEDSGYNEEYDIQNQLSIKHDSLVYLLWMGLQEANEKIKKLEEMIYDGKNNS